MSTHHELYGELLTAKETCELTGFTMNQLRNWRIPARRSLAPIGYVAIGATPYYRLKTVQAYLEKHGAQQGAYYPSELDNLFPIGETVALSAKENIGITTLKKVTSANVDSWINEHLNSHGLAWAKTWQGAWAEVEKALDLEPNFVLPQNRWSAPNFWSLAVHTARKLINEEQNLGFDLGRILELGESTAPTKEVKF